MSKNVTLTVFVALSAQGGIASADAASCDAWRGEVGVEGVGGLRGGGLWHPGGDAFRNNVVINTYAAASAHCTLTEHLTATAGGVLEYASALREPGLLEGERNSGLAIVGDAYLTYTPSAKVFIDAGKIRRSSGTLFSANPTDLLRNTSGNLRSVSVNADGQSRYGFYGEGSVGVRATVYGDAGTFELAALPKLTEPAPHEKSAEKWNMLERTNSTNRFYGAFTTRQFEDFNPTVNVMAGEYDALGVGVSGYVNDDLIVSVGASVARGERWRHLDTRAARRIRGYADAGNPFVQRKRRPTADLAVGLRYTSASRTEFGVEYYGQTQGYSRNEWRDYFDTVSFVNGGYADGIPRALAQSLATGYARYASLFSVEVDNANRGDNFLGKHYLTLFAKSKTEELRKVGWGVSSITSLVDGSTSINARLDMHVTKNADVYAGVSVNLGARRSEFGQFGRREGVYAGVRFAV